MSTTTPRGRATAGGIVVEEDTRGFTLVVAAVDSLDPTLAPVAYRCSGAADQVEINAAIVAVNAAGGGEVRLLEGTYVLAASVAPLSNVTLSGTGVATILDAGIAAHAFDLNNVQSIHITHLSCLTTAGGGSAFNPINIRGGCEEIHIEEVNILQSDNDGIAITSADVTVHLYGVEFTNIDNYPINCDGDDCDFIESEISGVIGNDGIFLDVNSVGCIVRRNHIHDWTGEPVDDDGDNIVEGNICTPLGSSVAAWNSKGCGFATIQETIDHQAGSGSIEIVAGTFTVAAGVISLDAADSSLRICGAGMVVTTLSSSTGTCLDINGAVNIQIEDLSVLTTGVGANDALVVRGASGIIHLTRIACSDAGQDAVSIASAAGNVFMEALDLSAAAADGIARYGVNIAGDNCKLTLSRINNTGDDGIWIQGTADGTIVRHNSISNWVGEACDDDGTRTDLPEIFMEVSDPNGSLGDHPVVILVDGEDTTIRFQLKVPKGFQDLVRAQVIVVQTVTAGSPDMQWSTTTEFGGICLDEAYNLHSDSETDEVTALTQNDFECVDISASLTDIAAEDLVGITFIRRGGEAGDDVNADVYYFGFRFSYV